MKKPLLITTTLVVLALSATSIYAQVVAGTSIVDKMKAAAHSFTLSSVLNPTDTGLQSSPIKGKKTGDILTAGEWNRVLELVAAGGSGISNVELVSSQDASPSAAANGTTHRVSQVNCPSGKKVISGGCSYPNTLNTFVHNTPTADLTGWLCGGLHHDGDTLVNTVKYPYRPTAYAICGEYGGGGGGSSGGTSNITWANFDGSGGVAMKGSNGITSIVRESAGNYRVTFATPRPNTDYGVICTSGPSPAYLCFPHEKSTTSFLIKTSNPSNNVDAPFVSLIVTPFDVGAGSVGASSPAFYYCTNAQSADANNAPCYGAKQNQGSGNGRYRTLVAHLSVPSFSPSNLSMFPWHDGTKWKCAISGVGHFDCTDGSVLVADTQVGGGALNPTSLYTKCTNAQSMDSANIPCYSASRNTGAGTDQYRVVSCTIDDGVRTYTAASILNFNNLVANKWAISVNGGTLQCVDGSILVAKIQ